MKIKSYLGAQWYNSILFQLAPSYSIEFVDEDPCDYVFIDNMFWVNKRRIVGDEGMREFAKEVSHDFSIPIIAIDHCDVPLPKYTEKDIKNFDLVLKGQCLPKDRDLMNWEIGVRYGLNRSKKIKKVSDDKLLSQESIEKHKLSFDLGFFRYISLDPSPTSQIKRWRWSKDAFFVGSFNSMNRLNGLRLLKDNFKAIGWLTQLDETHPIVGVERGCEVEVSSRLVKENKDLFQKRIPSKKFKKLAGSSKTVFAFSGIGELGERHYQAFEYNRLLVCEDVDYLDSIFNFQSGVNYIKLEDELENLDQEMQFIIQNDDKSREISQRGHDDYFKTYKNVDYIFKKYFLDYLSN